MDFKVRISEPALADLQEIIEYSWAKFPASAERFGSAILDHVELLGRFPYIGSPVIGRPGVRRVVHTPILIYYRIQEEREVVEILHFRHGHRPFPER